MKMPPAMPSMPPSALAPTDTANSHSTIPMLTPSTFNPMPSVFRACRKKMGKAGPSPFSSGLSLPEYGLAIGGIGAEGTAALRRLCELVRLPEIFHRIGVVDAEVKSAFGLCEPGIDTEWSAIKRAGQSDFRLAAFIAYHREVLGRGTVAENHALDLNRRESGPGIGIIGVAIGLSGNAECVTAGEDGSMANFPPEGVGRIVDRSPAQRVAELLGIEGGHHGAVGGRVENDGAGMLRIQVGHGDVEPIRRGRHKIMDCDGVPAVHDQRTAGGRRVFEHGVEGRGLGKVIAPGVIGNKLENRRARRKGVGREVYAESSVAEALADDRIGIKLQLHERLVEQAMHVGDRATEPERWSDVGNAGASIGGQYDGPREIAGRSWRAGNRRQFGFIVAHTALRVAHFKLSRNVFWMMSQAGIEGLRVQTEGEYQRRCEQEERSAIHETSILTGRGPDREGQKFSTL